jgi:hypothetical protein
MSVITFQEPATIVVIDFYVRTKRRHGLVVSTAQAMKATRAVLPRCFLDDRTLLDLIERAAIRSPGPVFFDFVAPKTAIIADEVPDMSTSSYTNIHCSEPIRP